MKPTKFHASNLLEFLRGVDDYGGTGASHLQTVSGSYAMLVAMTSTGNSDLDLAVSVAREAGALLRTEFHRPGGPRGHGGHAEIDRPTEELIRRRLLEARPDDAFLGEETGSADAATAPFTPASSAGTSTPATSAPPAGTSTLATPPTTTDPAAPRRWIVDPNDGTSEFLKGARGPSVSIALLIADRPALGVVYAYAAPDDRGDLICGGAQIGLWRGRGSEDELTGSAEPAPCSPSAAPGRVAVSSGAFRTDAVRAANAELCAPWQPVPVPGIAYRLALTAVGEVRVATTLTAPWSWDMAGGHALLLAGGGDLFTRDGTPVRYDSSGHCTYAPAYFGGSSADVERIRRRNWESLFVERPGRVR
ncbi:MAG: inositol monophosphatase family protein [Alkalispirochaeta sp.]